MSQPAVGSTPRSSSRRLTFEMAEEEPVAGPSLPPTDHGKAAYLILAGCALVQAPIWGYSLAFGVFQQYYASDSTLNASPSAIASIGTSQTGIMYLLMPLTFTILTRYPHLRRWCGPLGLLVTAVSIIVSSFASSIGQLIATQGVLYAVGCALLFSPTTLYLDEWFVEKKGLAYGIIWASKSLTGVAMPFLMSALLEKYGARTALQAWAVASSVLTVPLLVFLKPRIPLDASSTASPLANRQRQHRLSFAFMRRGLFWMIQVGNILQSFGYLMPSTYLASYAAYLGLPHVTGPMLLAVFSLASIPGALVLGMLGDRMAPTKVMLMASVGSAAAVFLLWGFSLHLSVLVLFCIMYGFFAGGFSSTWAGTLREMGSQPGERIDSGLVFGMFMGCRGLGFVISGPLSGVLLNPGASIGHDLSGYTSEYGPMIVCTGVTALLGGWGWLWTLRQPCRRLAARMLW